MDILVAAFGKQLKGEEAQIKAEDARKIVQDYFQGMAEREAEENAKKGEEFLAANKEKPGIVTTESGLSIRKLLPKERVLKPTLDQNSKMRLYWYKQSMVKYSTALLNVANQQLSR